MYNLADAGLKQLGLVCKWIALGFVAVFCTAVIVLGTLALAVLTMHFVTDRRLEASNQLQHGYATFAPILKQANRALDQNEKPVVVDLASLNGGAWVTACVFIQYQGPIKRMEGLGAIIKKADVDRFAERRGSRLEPVEEGEAVIAFMGEDRQAQFTRFGRGRGQYAELRHDCVTKPETRLTVSHQ